MAYKQPFRFSNPLQPHHPQPSNVISLHPLASTTTEMHNKYPFQLHAHQPSLPQPQPNPPKPTPNINNSDQIDLNVQTLPELSDTFFDFSSNSSPGDRNSVLSFEMNAKVPSIKCQQSTSIKSSNRTRKAPAPNLMRSSNFSTLKPSSIKSPPPISTTPTPKLSKLEYPSPKASKPFFKIHRKRISNSEDDLQGSQLNWRCGLDDTPPLNDQDYTSSCMHLNVEMGVEDEGSWYHGEENQQNNIEEDWFILPFLVQEQELTQEEDEGLSETENVGVDTDALEKGVEKWQVLPQTAEKGVSELKGDEEEIRRYQWGLRCAEIMEMGYLGWECLWMLGDRWIGCLEGL